jgi:NAD-dependent SIR2 family protein deacetylase
MDCIKCGKVSTTNWKYDTDIYGERLKRYCPHCGYSEIKPTLDAKNSASNSSMTLEQQIEKMKKFK